MSAPVHGSLAIAIVYGVLSAVALCLGKGLQKYGVEALAAPKRPFTREYRFRFFVWCLGTGGIVASTFLLFTACAYGPVTIAAGLSGTGLVAAALFGMFVLGERSTRTEMAGIGAIIVGSALTGYFQGPAPLTETGLSAEPILTGRLAVFTVATAGAAALASAYSTLGAGARAALILGSTSGVCGGLGLLFQKGAMVHCTCVDLFADVPAVLRNPFFYPFVVFGVLDLVVTQFALKRGRAVSVVPSYQSFYMLVPVVGGMVGFAERLAGWQLVGLALLLIGVVLLSRFVAQDAMEARPLEPSWPKRETVLAEKP